MLALVLALALCVAEDSGTTVLFSDSFDQWQPAWMAPRQTENFSATYENGSLHLVDRTDGTHYNHAMNATNPSLQFSDVILDIDTELVGGTAGNLHVVECRYLDADNHYAFYITSGGMYGIYKYVGGVPTTLVDTTASAAIVTAPGASNHMRIECIGTNLAFAVNGEQLARIQDASLSNGRIALAAIAYDDEYTRIAFDNLTIARP
jgi:hypothetical protein